MRSRIRFILNRIRELLWVKPLVVCILSILAVFLASIANHFNPGSWIPDITADSIETLLVIIASSMLVISIFAVGSMIAAYESASNSATPRSFSVVIADDTSQNALSTFIGAFIFSVVALVALQNGYYEKVGRFALFLITLSVFAVVIINFLRWIDRIARLGRLFSLWNEAKENRQTAEAEFDRVAVPELSLDDMFDDAFNPIARDGAGLLEVAIRLQKAFLALAELGNPLLAEAARSHAQLALRHAEAALRLPEEVAMLQSVCGGGGRATAFSPTVDGR